MPTSLEKYLNPAGLDETVLNIRQIAEGLEADMQELPYARPDGLYPDMTVGAVIGADETAQWATRESMGSGAATVRSVQGAAIGWNQLNQNNRNSATLNGVTFTNNNDGTWTVSGTATSDASKEVSTVPRENGHKYLVRGCPSGGSASTYFVSIAGGVHDVGDGYIYISPTYTSTALYIVVKAGTTVDNLIFTPQLFNLTQMFGSGNEPTTVAEFERMCPESYYPYSAPTLKPVQIAGIASTDAQGGELDAIEWTAQTLRAAGTIRDELTADELVTRVGGVDMGTLTWRKYSSSGDVGYYFAADIVDIAQGVAYLQPSNLECARYTVVAANWETNIGDKQISKGIGATNVVMVKDSAYTEAADFKAAMAGVLLYYELATPTTTPISPVLPMTYRVQEGGGETIIVPDGEVSAAPVLTVAEPVNMSTELARIWAAIEQLQSHGTAQLSRADAASIEEVQKDTAEIAEIDTTKEVTE